MPLQSAGETILLCRRYKKQYKRTCSYRRVFATWSACSDVIVDHYAQHTSNAGATTHSHQDLTTFGLRPTPQTRSPRLGTKNVKAAMGGRSTTPVKAESLKAGQSTQEKPESSKASPTEQQGKEVPAIAAQESSATSNKIAGETDKTPGIEVAIFEHYPIMLCSAAMQCSLASVLQ